MILWNYHTLDPLLQLTCISLLVITTKNKMRHDIPRGQFGIVNLVVTPYTSTRHSCLFPGTYSSFSDCALTRLFFATGDGLSSSPPGCKRQRRPERPWSMSKSRKTSTTTSVDLRTIAGSKNASWSVTGTRNAVEKRLLWVLELLEAQCGNHDDTFWNCHRSPDDVNKGLSGSIEFIRTRFWHALSKSFSSSFRSRGSGLPGLEESLESSSLSPSQASISNGRSSSSSL